MRRWGERGSGGGEGGDGQKNGGESVGWGKGEVKVWSKGERIRRRGVRSIVIGGSKGRG